MINDQLALQKQQLMEESEAYSTLFSNRLRAANNNLQHLGVKALLTLGAIVATYYIAKVVFNGSRKKTNFNKSSSELRGADVAHSRGPSMVWSLYNMVRQQLMIFLLAFLRQKLAEYLETVDKEGVLNQLSSFVKSSFNTSLKKTDNTLI